MVQGSLIAARHLRDRGGAIINTGSILGDHSVVLQGPYCATKHAVKGFTDALRMELEHEGAPISVTLIKPSAIDTPFFEHARSYMGARGVRNPPPAYDPRLVAEAMLFACQNTKRDLVVGMGGFALPLLGAHFPRATDRLLENTMVYYQKSDIEAPRGWRDNLYAPRTDGEEHSHLPGPAARKTSLFLKAQMYPMAATAVAAGLGLGIAAVVKGLGRRGTGQGPATRNGRVDLPMGEW